MFKILAGIKIREFRGHLTREIKSPRNLIPVKINPFKVYQGNGNTVGKRSTKKLRGHPHRTSSQKLTPRRGFLVSTGQFKKLVS